MTRKRPALLGDSSVLVLGFRRGEELVGGVVLNRSVGVVGVSNLHIYAAMRGETLEAFQRTRNAPGALYSVAGKDAGKLAWEKPGVAK